MSKQPNFENIPYTSRECHKKRKSLLGDILKSDHKELSDFVNNEMESIKNQGAAYGVLAVSAGVALTYIKIPVFKAHVPGIFLGLTLGYLVGGVSAMELGLPQAVEKLGVIKENQDLENRRKEVLEKCKTF